MFTRKVAGVFTRSTLLGDEDLDGESPIPVELFAVQVSPATPLTELGNDSVRELVLTAPLELAAEIIEEPAIGLAWFGQLAGCSAQ